MIFVLVLLVIVILLFCYLFFAPFYLEINSIKGFLKIRFHKLASVSVMIINDSVLLDMRIAGWKKQMDLLETTTVQKKKPVKKKKELKKEKSNISPKKIMAVLASFKVKQCDVSIDTGDVQLNGILYPVFYLVQCYSKKNMQINFTGENKLVLEIENSLARMSRAYIGS